ncbi:SMI1/KNR4 family protein [Hymenobacter metallilatus]|uniref:Knr4/Smi1-like domain-containing protein n=1 Tax=Hymenobacter metallilatus TaxID=2493666 RepID=A0A3R9NSL8_9BACT|nr:SMI1/KNR4 family protein [Hymenobacter metallilatus]RSK36312.1 hypothetical protein EI290_05370 [Hymenobacter metallilatus]
MNKLSELNDLWKKAKIRTVDTATEQQVSEFEATHNLIIPHDLRGYFVAVNGTDRLPDNEFYTFCTLEQFQPITKVLDAWKNGIPRHSDVLEKIGSPQNCFVFADYSIYLFAYAIRLYPTESAQNEVYAICGGEYRIIAKSFSEFIDLYLQQADELTFCLIA